jgi:hypothetical protein
MGDGEPAPATADRDLIERHVARVIVTPQALEVRLNPAGEQAEDPSASEQAPSRPPITIKLPWIAPSFVAIKGILHAPSTKPAMSPERRCRACREDFTITSGTLFAFHKLPLRGYLAAIAIFCNEVKGKSALAISRDLGLSYKAAFVLLHKLREAMAEEMKGRKLGGAGIVAEVDGGYFGGYVKPANHVENRRDRRLARNQTGKRKAVVIIRERNGRSLPAVFRTEGQALSFIRSRIAKGTIVNADESSSWDALHAQYEMKRINHEEAYSMDGACTNWAEEFFSRMRRAEQGHHHHIAGPYLLRYAQEASWREDHRPSRFAEA